MRLIVIEYNTFSVSWESGGYGILLFFYFRNRLLMESFCNDAVPS